MLTDNAQRIAAFRSTTTLPGLTAKKTITFVTATTGAVASTKIFTVTGACLVSCFATCSVDLTGTGATIEVGITGTTNLLIDTTTCTAIDAGEMVVTTTPATSYAITDFTKKVISTDINLKVTTHTVDAGVLTIYCLFTPLTDDGNVAPV